MVQRWNEIGQFMDFAEDTGVHTSLPFLFATGRTPRDYKSKRPSELTIHGVHISCTFYVKTEAQAGCTIQTKPICTWIPTSIMCF